MSSAALFRYSKRKNKKVHLCNADGKTLCKMENSSARRNLTETSNELPPGRSICGVCKQLARKGEKAAKQKPARGSNGFYASWEWAKARYQVLKAYGAVCMCCGSDRSIVVDHIAPRSKEPERELDLTNLQVLCSLCNRGKGAWDETDFRPSGWEALLYGVEAPLDDATMRHMEEIMRRTR